MRPALLCNPSLLLERLGAAAERRRRLKKLRGTVAENLQIGHIDSLELLELMRDNPPNVVYDIGASVATWTLLARSIFPKAEIHAFEPLESQRREFSAKTKGIPGIHLHPVALGSIEGDALMNVTDSVDSSSLLAPAKASYRDFGAKAVAQEGVRVSKLDDYVVKKSLPWPDLIKLDVQGYELDVLRSAPSCLSRVTALISEVSFQEYYVGQPLFHELVKFCASYSLFVVALGKGTALGVRLKYTDALFFKPSTAHL